MCLILFGKTSDIISLDLRRAWTSNDDGAGIVILGKPATMQKGLMTWKRFRKAIFRCSKDANIAVHLRQATHGAPSPKWCHPFDAGDDCWLMHNGVFHTLGERGHDGISDSAHLADILTYLPMNQKLSLLKEIVGYSNRCLLIKHDSFAVFGTWHTYKNVQMSNTLLLPPVTHSYNGWPTQQANDGNLPVTTNVRQTSYSKGKWRVNRDYKNITEESKHQIDLPLKRCNGDIAALPTRSEIAELFRNDNDPAETLYDAYLHNIYGD